MEKRIIEFLYKPVDFRLLTILPIPASRAYNIQQAPVYKQKILERARTVIVAALLRWLAEMRMFL